MTRILIGVISMSGLTRGSLHRDQQYMEWLKKVNEDLRKGGRAKADIAGRDKGTARE